MDSTKTEVGAGHGLFAGGQRRDQDLVAAGADNRSNR